MTYSFEWNLELVLLAGMAAAIGDLVDGDIGVGDIGVGDFGVGYIGDLGVDDYSGVDFGNISSEEFDDFDVVVIIQQL